MRICLLFGVLLFTGIGADCQNLIGYNDKEIREYMKKYCREMNFEKVTNSTYKYLKYSDSSESQTVLFFLDNDSICKNVRMICETGIRKEKVKEFDSNYSKCGGNRWVEKKECKEYLIEIKDEKWSCIITIEPYK